MRVFVRLLPLCVLAVLVLSDGERAEALPPPGQAEIFAGSGSPDGQSATNAPLQPYDIAVNGADVYVTDAVTCRLRRITGGQIFTVAGSGSCAYSGDGGPAISAGMMPVRLAVSPSGDLYFSDGCRIRRVSGGIVTTAVGNGVCGFAGDGGASTSAQIGGAGGIAFTPSGELLFTDSCRVRKVGFFITTIAGNAFCGFGGDGGPASAAFFHSPAGLTVAPSGDVFIADNNNCSVRKISSGTITSIAGVYRPCDHTGDGGLAMNAPLNYPTDVVLDASGNQHIAVSCKVRSVVSGVINSEAFTGSCSSGTTGDGGPPLSATGSAGRVEMLGNDLLIADGCNLRIISGGVISNFAGAPAFPYQHSTCGTGGDGGDPIDASFASPRGVNVTSAGDVYVNENECRIRKISASVITVEYEDPECGLGGADLAASGDLYIIRHGRVRRLSGGTLFDDVHVAGSLFSNSQPADVSVDPTTGDVYVASNSCHIVRIPNTGFPAAAQPFAGQAFTCTTSGDGGPPAAARFTNIRHIEVGPTGDLYVSLFACSVRKISGGVVSTVAPLNSGFCGSMSVDGTGLYAVNGCSIKRMNTGGPTYTLAAQTCPTGTINEHSWSHGDLDAAGNLYVSHNRSTFFSAPLNKSIWIIAADGDVDLDGIADASDNCPSDANPLQENNDRNFIDNPGVVPDDTTRTNSDSIGDICDPDDDNDGLSDVDESSLPGAACPMATASTNPLVADSDGDNYLDGAECALSTSPNTSAVKPVFTACGANGDQDGDGLADRIEYCFYNSDILNANTDSDACTDGKEVASMNDDNYVSSGDQGLMASARPPNPYVANFDPNKDGIINSGDQGFQASKFGPCP